jgi:hypothetical protein
LGGSCVLKFWSPSGLLRAFFSLFEFSVQVPSVRALAESRSIHVGLYDPCHCLLPPSEPWLSRGPSSPHRLATVRTNRLVRAGSARTRVSACTSTFRDFRASATRSEPFFSPHASRIHPKKKSVRVLYCRKPEKGLYKGSRP